MVRLCGAVLLGLQLGCGVSCSETEAEQLCEAEFPPEPVLSLGPASPTPCDPLDQAPPKLRIQPSVLVAEDADGVLYVVDRVLESAPSRVFTGGEDGLQRLYGGLMGIHSGLLGFRTYDPDLHLLVRTTSSPGHINVSETTVRLFRGALPGPDWAESFEEGEPLIVREECAAAGIPVSNLDVQPSLQYFAQDEQGNHLLVALPLDYDVEAGQFYVFYGPPSGVLQRAPRYFSRKKNGDAKIGFILDGGDAEASFLEGGCAPQDRPCPGTLTLPDNSTLTLTRGDYDPEGMTFICHAPE